MPTDYGNSSGAVRAEHRCGRRQDDRQLLEDIGCGKAQTAGTFFSGLIDDVRIYSRPVKP